MYECLLDCDASKLLETKKKILKEMKRWEF